MTQRSPDETVQRRGFATSARRRNRIAAGVALAALAVGGNFLVYSSLQSAEPVAQAVVDIPAGAQITSEMLRTVDVDVDSSVNVIPADDLSTVVGQYAKVRIVSGSLVTQQSLQSSPLVEPGNAVVAIQVREGSLPVGLRERVPVQLVIPAGPAAGDAAGEPTVIPGTVVALPITPPNAIGTQSLSVEVASADAPSLAAADDVRVVLTEPAITGQTPTAPPDTGED
jgi:SAF domain